jgi:uncharacterized membrane protein
MEGLMTRKGCLVVKMCFRVPVTVDLYKTAYNKEVHEITQTDIINVEIDNFAANPESYQEMLSEHLDSLTFDFEEVTNE